MEKRQEEEGRDGQGGGGTEWKNDTLICYGVLGSVRSLPFHAPPSASPPDHGSVGFAGYILLTIRDASCFCFHYDKKILRAVYSVLLRVGFRGLQRTLFMST